MYGGTTEGFRERMKPWVVQAPLMRPTKKEWEGYSDEMKKRVEQDGGRDGYPEEVAGVVGMLCTPDGAWCTGSVICANGGMVMGL